MTGTGPLAGNGPVTGNGPLADDRAVRRRIRPETGLLAQPEHPSLRYGYQAADGPEVLMVHGLGARWQVFTPLFAQFRDEYACYACDLRGHGESDRSGRYRIGDFVDDVARFIEAVMRPPVHLYGHSLGGWVALRLAADRPDLVAGLVIADSAVYSDSLDPNLAITYLADLPLALRSLARSLDQLDPEVMTQFRDGRMLADYRPAELLARLTRAPTLIQADPARGGLMTDSDVTRVRAIVPDTTHVRIDGVGHGLHVEDVYAVRDVVRDAFDRTADATAPQPLRRDDPSRS